MDSLPICNNEQECSISTVDGFMELMEKDCWACVMEKDRAVVVLWNTYARRKEHPDTFEMHLNPLYEAEQSRRTGIIAAPHVFLAQYEPDHLHLFVGQKGSHRFTMSRTAPPTFGKFNSDEQW